MKNVNRMVKQKYIFARLFLLSNKLQVIGDQVLSDEMTIMQWLMTAAIARCGDKAPTLGELAELMGSSHQNIKQLAIKLNKRGFLKLESDVCDHRAIRLVLTEKSCTFWEKHNKKIKFFLAELFKDFSQYDMYCLQDCLSKLYKNILNYNKKK